MATAIDLFRDRCPARPRCTDDLREGTRIRPKDKALSHRLIEPNTRGKIAWIAFDVDRPHAALDWEDCPVPPPTLTAQNPENGHAHLLYALSAPVAISAASRPEPMRYLATIERSLRAALSADPGYAGMICKNPTHPHWRVTQWAGAYDLDEIAEHVPLIGKPAANERVSGLGRNVDTFDRLRLYAYKAVRPFWRPGGGEAFESHLMAVTLELQAHCHPPLPHNECRHIARSVARWVWKKFSPDQFRALQAARGRRKGAGRRDELMPQVMAMRAEGHSQTVIADTLGISQKTVCNWLKAAT